MAKYLGNIEELLSAVPELTRYSAEQWEKSLSNLKELGFNARKFPHMLTQNPALLTKPREKVKDAMNNWAFLDFGKKETYLLIERYPELLEVKNFDRVHENLSIVKGFVGQKHGYKVMRNSPNLVSDSLKVLEEKVTYLKNVMRVDPIEVYKSDVFSLDLLTLKTRHAFLERLGMWFEKKNPRKGDRNDAHEVKRNIKLSKITDSSDKRFAVKVCFVTLEEYETFVEMFKEEIDEEKEDGRIRRRVKYADNVEEDFDEDDDNSHEYYNK